MSLTYTNSRFKIAVLGFSVLLLQGCKILTEKPANIEAPSKISNQGSASSNSTDVADGKNGFLTDKIPSPNIGEDQSLSVFVAEDFVKEFWPVSLSNVLPQPQSNTAKLANDATSATDTIESGDTATLTKRYESTNAESTTPTATSNAVDITTEKDLWVRIRKGFKLDLNTSNRRIDLQFNWYAKNQKYLTRVFNRSARYMHHIVERLEAHDMPLELALLPVVESAFDPFAYSHGRASGLWQFIPGTGKIYGLKQNWWYDGRRDVAASTQAAIDYLSSLHRRFNGDWLHALASYNTGSGRVSKAIKSNKKRGKPTDFWHLKLPRETRAYVPKLIAISKLVADPGKYGITLPPLENKPVFKTVTFESQLDLAQAANLAGIDMETLYLFNPAFNQWATPPTGPHRLLLPLENAEKFAESLKNLPKEDRLSWNRYSVQRGDSLIKIARKFNTTPGVIKEVNRLRSNTIRIKQKLLIPTASKKQAFYGLSSSNRLSSKQSKISAPKNSKKLTHLVKAGDTLWDLSLKHKVSMRSIAKWNGMAPTDVLKPGTSLLIYSKQSATVAKENIPYIPPQREMIKKVGYRVRKGDSLARIAGKFGVSVNELVRWNKLDRSKYLQPGQRLTIFVDITQT